MAAVFYRFFQIYASLATVFSFCEFGHRVSSAFEEAEDSFYRLQWYSFPVEIWQMLPTVFIAAQQPINFFVFGSISCSREDFKLVQLQNTHTVLIVYTVNRLNYGKFFNVFIFRWPIKHIRIL